MSLKNDLFLRALRGEVVNRPPVWMMRQAGRYLPDFIKLKEKYPFFDRVQNPELATEITVMPIHQVGVDAAILFSDILVIPQAMNIDVKMVPGKGPVIPDPIRTLAQIEALNTADAAAHLDYVMQAIKLTKQALNEEVPLIGFAGSPWTILCYAVEGSGSKDFSLAKSFCFQNPTWAHLLLTKITDITIDYLLEKVKAGVDAVQIFDSWGGMLGPDDYKIFSQPYIQRIVDALKDHAPVIVFGKGCWYALKDYSQSGASALGVDWTITPQLARELSGGQITLQGNFDPSRLLAPIPEIKRMAKEMADAFGYQRYIANLGHGILPHVPVDHARAFVDTIKNLG
jgi:uroporphyrinogen decarboxylase